MMASLVAAATAALAPMLYKDGQRQVPTLSASTGETWANSGSPFKVLYEEASIYSQGQFDYQAPAGYAYDLWVLPSVTVNAGDRVVVADDAITFKVVEAAPVASPGPLRRLRCNRVS